MSTPYNEALGATLIERAVRERIVLVGVTFPGSDDETTEASLDELAAARSTRPAPTRSGGCVQRRDHPTTRGSSARARPTELHELCLAVDADTVVFDNELSPAQQYNLEKLLGRTAIDRTAVILDIFAQNAAHPGGQGPGRAGAAALPPAPAAPRGRRQAVQQRGGVGTRFGGGETKLEVDRRRIMRRISRLETELDELGRTRDAAAPAARSQRARRRHDRRLHQRRQVDAAQHAHRRRRARPRTACSPRSTRPPGAWRCRAASRCCSPTRSASSAACRTASSRRSRARSRSPAAADYLVHVVDASAADPEGQIAAVRDVLDEIGAGAVPELLVVNKADVAPDAAKQVAERPSRFGGHQRRHRRGRRRVPARARRPAAGADHGRRAASCPTSAATCWRRSTARARSCRRPTRPEHLRRAGPPVRRLGRSARPSSSVGVSDRGTRDAGSSRRRTRTSGSTGCIAVADRFDGGVVDLSIGTPMDPPPTAVVAAFSTSGAERGYPPSIGTAELARRGRAAGSTAASASTVAAVGDRRLHRHQGVRRHAAAVAAPAPPGARHRAVPGDVPTRPTRWARSSPAAAPSPCRRRPRRTRPRRDRRRRRRPGAGAVGQQPGQPDGRPRRPRPRPPSGAARTACRSSPTSATSSSRGTARRGRSSQHGIDGVVAVHSLSKRSNLAGGRVGFYAGDADLVRYLQEVRKHVGMMVPGPAQAAAVVALDDDEHVEVQRQRYRRRLERVADDPRCVVGRSTCRCPAGGFYLWFPVERRLGVRRAAGRATAARWSARVSSTGRASTDHVRVAVVQPDDRIELGRRAAGGVMRKATGTAAGGGGADRARRRRRGRRCGWLADERYDDAVADLAPAPVGCDTTLVFERRRHLHLLRRDGRQRRRDRWRLRVRRPRRTTSATTSPRRRPRADRRRRRRGRPRPSERAELRQRRGQGHRRVRRPTSTTTGDYVAARRGSDDPDVVIRVGQRPVERRHGDAARRRRVLSPASACSCLGLCCWPLDVRRPASPPARRAQWPPTGGWTATGRPAVRQPAGAPPYGLPPPQQPTPPVGTARRGGCRPRSAAVAARRRACDSEPAHHRDDAAVDARPRPRRRPSARSSSSPGSA